MSDIKKFKQLWSKFMYILTPTQKRWGIVVFIMSIMGSLAEMLGVSVILPLVQVMIEPEQLLKVNMIKDICDKLNFVTTKQLIILMTVIVIAVYILKNLFMSFNLWVRTKFSMKVQREMSIKMIRSYNNRGYNFFRKTTFAVYQRGVSASASAVNSCITYFFKLLAEILTIMAILVYVAITDWMMMVTLIVLAGICLGLILIFFRSKMQNAGNLNHKYSAINGQWLTQLYYGIKEIIVMNRKEYFVRNYEKSNIKVQKTSIQLSIAQEIPAYVIEGLCIMGLMISVCYRLTTMENPANYLPQLAAFAVAAFRVLPSLGRISSTFNGLIFQVPYVNEAYENVKAADEANAEYENKQNKLNKDWEGIDANAFRFRDKLEISDIKFRYPDGQEWVLNGINIDIHKGESIAFVGPSGAGKSTLADIILGLMEPQNGEILVDGVQINGNSDLWSKLIGFVPQSPYLIADTVRRNVGFGLYDDKIDDDRIWEVLKKAQLKDVIESMPDGLDTIVGERGVRFSGGQSQRLVIARALYNDPDILVLDEATSALDSDTEKAVMEAIDALQGQKTLIIIAHRLTTIKNCNRIFEIKDGNAVEKRYEELI